MNIGQETQAQFAQRMYDARAQAYDDSWHPEYTRQFIALLDIQSGDRVLDLCCGTGLNSFAAAGKVGPGGRVVGVDVSEGMLAVARGRQEADSTLGPRCSFANGDVTELASALSSLDELSSEESKKAYDWIICSHSFVLLENPEVALSHWATYLSPKGRIALDVPHEQHFPCSAILEETVRRMGATLPFSPSWVKSSASLVELAERRDLAVDSSGVINGVTGKAAYYEINQCEEQFDGVMKGPLVNLATPEFVQVARPIFREEWERSAVNGKVEVVDSFYYYVLRKA